MSLPPAVILAAGESSRFWPLSTHGHKSLHRLAGKAIIEYTVESLAQAGIDRIIVVQSPIARAAHFPHRTIADQLGDGSSFGATIQYIDQPEAVGQGDAVLRAARLLDGEFLVVQPENINAGEIVTELLKQPGDAIAVHEREDTWLFGVAAVDGDRLAGFVEKPEAGKEPSRYCNMGVWKLTPDYVETLKDVPADPLSNITALLARASRGEVGYVVTKHPFFPLKYPWHLFAMAQYLTKGKPYLGENVEVADSASVGRGCVVEADAIIGPNVTLKECLIGAGSRIDSWLAQTIVGADVLVEPDTVIEHTALEGGRISVDVKGHQVVAELSKLGAAIGQGSVLKSGARVAPGVLIGAEATVTAGRPVTTNVPDRATVGN